jgi:SNF2 family DNA or RNA helicase
VEGNPVDDHASTPKRPDDVSSISDPISAKEETWPAVEVEAISLVSPVEIRSLPRFEKPLEVSVRQASLLSGAPWVRSLGKITMDVPTQGWRFPTPLDQPQKPTTPKEKAEETPATLPLPVTIATPGEKSPSGPGKTRLKPPPDTVLFKDRLLYLLQPPLEDLFSGKVDLPFKPFPYQVKGIAFLMPRHAALLADEMGLGKTVQVIVALRLLFHAGAIHRALVVCPKPLVINWTRELRTWAEDIPFEVITGDTETRRAAWHVSNCPLKVVNYELLTRDVAELEDPKLHFDVAVLDEAQRIKSKDSKTAQAVCSINRSRSWAMSGTPIENKVEDLINIFAFVDSKRIPPDTPARMLPALTSDSILRRTKDDVATDMPPRIIKDQCIELTPAQRETYDLAEKDGVVHLNALGDTITVQHVFELVMRLKQICNFDPRTGQSAKLDLLAADMEEVAANNRKAIVFSQWVEPLEQIARTLKPFGPLQYHGKIANKDRQPILDQFKSDPSKHVILMSYGTGSVGLNLQFTNYVFLFDRWWNPAIEDQAINRAHRLGQKSSVFVSRFVASNTIEERIAEVLDKKRQLFNELIAQNGPPPCLGLTEDDVFGLFDIRSRPKRAAA